MSRIGRKPVAIPDKVKVEQKGAALFVSGPLGNLEQVIPEGMQVDIGDKEAAVQAPKRDRHNAGYQGLVRSLLANMVEGVTQGFGRDLEINGVGYKASLKGQELTMLLGYSHPVVMDLPKTIKCEIDKSQTKISIKGIDKQLVMQTAAKIRDAKIPEPYKAKGVKYADETIRRKAGKAGGK